MKKIILGMISFFLITTQGSLMAEAATKRWELNESQQWNYYIDNKKKVVGWQYINQKWYYFDNNGEMLVGWQYINHKWYYLNVSGEMLVGWQYINHKWYYLNVSGEMLVGWQYINHKWYYLSISGEMLAGWQYINHKWYYLNVSGEMLVGWQYINHKWYYLNVSGEMLVSWQYINHKWYYLDSSGAMQSGWLFYDNFWYYLQPSGELFENESTQFLGSILSDAIEVANKAKLFPSVMVAQATLESGYGTSLLVKEANNYFGMKFKLGEDEGKYDIFYKETQEYDKETDEWSTVLEPFRKYTNKKDSFNDYAFKLRNGVSWDVNYYQGTWRENGSSYLDVTASLQGKYATDPNYADKLNSFVESWQLYKID
ncbi:glucosaminidase domain-containing protein [Enterococcus lemanii]|uniref:Glucosaminidase domain-containing protein n=2 Tax=Enterococcus lemanii TaxID=1159752 RepID=A0ABV9MUB1_9ENTE